MNIGRIKAFSWLAVVALGGYIGWDVYLYFDSGKHQPKYLPREVQEEVLKSIEVPEEEKPQVVDYSRVQATFFDLNWTGREPPKPPPPPPPKDEKKRRDATPVAQLLTVVMIQYFTSDPEVSQASIRYKPAVPTRGTPDAVVRVGDRLPGKFSFVQIASIEPEYVEFAFDEEEGEEPREPERVRPPEYERSRGEGPMRIALVDPDGRPLEVPLESLIPSSPEQERFRPHQTRETRKNQWEIGSEDAQRFGEDYSSILTQDVRHSRYRDPTTGRYAGIRINEIRAGSIVERHGLMAGDIIKSINGEPVTSPNEAISYVKTHADVTTHWVAVVERQGKDITLTYDYSPPSK